MSSFNFTFEGIYFSCHVGSSDFDSMMRNISQLISRETKRRALTEDHLELHYTDCQRNDIQVENLDDFEYMQNQSRIAVIVYDKSKLTAKSSPLQIFYENGNENKCLYKISLKYTDLDNLKQKIKSKINFVYNDSFVGDLKLYWIDKDGNKIGVNSMTDFELMKSKFKNFTLMAAPKVEKESTLQIIYNDGYESSFFYKTYLNSTSFNSFKQNLQDEIQNRYNQSCKEGLRLYWIEDDKEIEVEDQIDLKFMIENRQNLTLMVSSNQKVQALKIVYNNGSKESFFYKKFHVNSCNFDKIKISIQERLCKRYEAPIEQELKFYWIDNDGDKNEIMDFKDFDMMIYKKNFNLMVAPRNLNIELNKISAAHNTNFASVQNEFGSGKSVAEENPSVNDENGNESGSSSYVELDSIEQSIGDTLKSSEAKTLNSIATTSLQNEVNFNKSPTQEKHSVHENLNDKAEVFKDVKLDFKKDIENFTLVSFDANSNVKAIESSFIDDNTSVPIEQNSNKSFVKENNSSIDDVHDDFETEVVKIQQHDADHMITHMPQDKSLNTNAVDEMNTIETVSAESVLHANKSDSNKMELENVKMKENELKQKISLTDTAIPIASNQDVAKLKAINTASLLVLKSLNNTGQNINAEFVRTGLQALNNCSEMLSKLLNAMDEKDADNNSSATACKPSNDANSI